MDKYKRHEAIVRAVRELIESSSSQKLEQYSDHLKELFSVAEYKEGLDFIKWISENTEVDFDCKKIKELRSYIYI